MSNGKITLGFGGILGILMLLAASGLFAYRQFNPTEPSDFDKIEKIYTDFLMKAHKTDAKLLSINKNNIMSLQPNQEVHHIATDKKCTNPKHAKKVCTTFILRQYELGTVSYIVDGKEYVNKLIPLEVVMRTSTAPTNNTSYNALLQPNDNIAIYYDPDNPNKILFANDVVVASLTDQKKLTYGTTDLPSNVDFYNQLKSRKTFFQDKLHIILAVIGVFLLISRLWKRR